MRFLTSLAFRINTKKFDINPTSKVDNIEPLVEFLDCKLSSLRLTYVGLPLGAASKDCVAWNPMVERIDKKLVRCQTKHLL